MVKERAPRNRTISISGKEQTLLKKGLFYPNEEKMSASKILNKTICADLFFILDLLPNEFVDLLIIDPPYNLDKNFNGFKFSKTGDDAYLEYLKSWFPKIMKTLKPNGPYIFAVIGKALFVYIKLCVITR